VYQLVCCSFLTDCCKLQEDIVYSTGEGRPDPKVAGFFFFKNVSMQTSTSNGMHRWIKNRGVDEHFFEVM
jgi:hypothetical protein